jgi:hypothetical protein
MQVKMVARKFLSVSAGGFPRPNESPSFTSITFAPRWFPSFVSALFLFFLERHVVGRSGECGMSGRVLVHLFQPYPADMMEMYAVSPLVNNVRNDSIHLLDPVQDASTPHFALIDRPRMVFI